MGGCLKFVAFCAALFIGLIVWSAYSNRGRPAPPPPVRLYTDFEQAVAQADHDAGRLASRLATNQVGPEDTEERRTVYATIKQNFREKIAERAKLTAAELDSIEAKVVAARGIKGENRANTIAEILVRIPIQPDRQAAP